MRRVVWRVSWRWVLSLLVLFGFAGLFGTVWQPVELARAQSDKSAKAEVDVKVPKEVMNGWRWFHVYCFRCHGMDAVGSQLAPNLRESIKNLSPEEFQKIVREGKPNTAMAPWNKLLDDSQINDLHQYVLARSEGRLGRGRPDEQ